MNHVEGFLPPYRVLDLADERGAFCGKLLADLGADVIKVEPPAGDAARCRPPFHPSLEISLDFLAYNTNKRSLALDITHSAGRECFLALVRNADALIESFPPDHLERIGLGHSLLREANPRLVIASITPYGQTGPRRHHLSCDLIAMATSGFMQITGDPDGPPTRLGNEQSRFAPALYAALGVIAALFHREWHHAAGQHVDVSMQEALLSFYLEQHPVLCWDVRRKNVTRVGPVSSLSVPAGVFPCQDGWVGLGIFSGREWETLSRWLYDVTRREEILAAELRGGIHARAPYRDLIEAVLLDFTLRQTRAQLVSEGQRRNLVVVAVNTIADLLADPALTQANCWKELDHPVAGSLSYPMNLLGAEVPVAGRAAPLLGEANADVLCGELGLTRTDLDSLCAAGVAGSDEKRPLSPLHTTGKSSGLPGRTYVCNLSDLSRHAHAGEHPGGKAEGGCAWIPAFETVDLFRTSFPAIRISSPALPAGEEEGEGSFPADDRNKSRRSARFHDNVRSPAPSPAGNAGEGHIGPSFQRNGAEAANPQRHPLTGVRVVEFGPFIALPLTGRILAALGATVIKVETNELLDQLIFVPPWGMGMGQPEYQALKRRITLDARTPEGAAVLDRLLAASDVFLTNFRRGALARWGLDLDELRRRHPELIIVHQTGFGAGAYETYKLYGIMAQHVCGVSMLSGLPEQPPCCLNSAYSDYHTPLFQAIAVLGALDRRRRSGRGTLVEGSIFRSGVATVATALLEGQVTGRSPERRGNHDPVAVPHNVYPCRGEDEWCAVAVWNEPQWHSLCGVLGHPEWAADPHFATPRDRHTHENELDAQIAAVTRRWSKHELANQLQAGGVPAGIVAKGEDLASDPQLRSRDVYRRTAYYVSDPKRPSREWERGPDVLAARLPLLLSDTPCFTGPYRRIGEDNDHVYRDLLGMSPEEMSTLIDRGVLQ